MICKKQEKKEANEATMKTKELLKMSLIYRKFYRPLKQKIIRKRIQSNPKKYIEKRYYTSMKRHLDLENPILYTEKIQYRKLYEKKTLYTKLADKVTVREYVNTLMDEKLKSGELAFPELYGIYDNPEDIRLENLPQSFVLKSNHASGHVILVEDKSSLKWKQEVKKMKAWMETNFYYVDAEWQYKNIKPKIICEELLDDDIIDYRFFCFKGEPYIIKVTRHSYKNRIHVPKQETYFSNWTPVPFEWNKEFVRVQFDKPNNWETMLDIARNLAKGFEFVRVDLYTIRDQIYFSEYTFTPNSGFEKDLPLEWDKKLGSMFDVEKIE